MKSALERRRKLFGILENENKAEEKEMSQLRLDRELIQNISPAKIADYLHYKGWRKEKEVEGIASLWCCKNQNNKKITLLLPLDREFADFAIKIEELLSIVAKIEKRSEAEVLKAL